MQPSGVKTISIPEIGNNAPSRLAQAGSVVPMRVLVRNTGAVLMVIAHEVNALNDLNSMASCYQLPAGQAEVFVLAPGQAIFGCSKGSGGQASVAWSEAIPVQKFMES